MVERAARSACPAGTRDLLRKLGAREFCQWILKQKRLLLTDTTMRDAHQSLLATRLRTFDMLAIAPFIARELPGLFSLEMWGGATFDTAMRFLQEDPWARLAQLRARIPNILFQMLLRGSNAVGYTSYPDNVVVEFIRRSAEAGIDVFRIFDSLNVPANMKVAIHAVRSQTDALCEAAICYTGDILDPRRTRYSLKYYVRMARELVRMGTHILGIKDMAGLCKPYAAYALVKALREEVGVPIHFHTHDTSGINAASVLRAADAGVHIADAAMAALSGQTSQPNLNSIVAALANTPRDTQISLPAANRVSDYWERVRALYYPFEEDIKTGTAEVYEHEMPGGQYTNLKQQAKALHLEDRWREVASMYATVNRMFGDIVKVTPSSKVVGDMALFMVTNNLTPEDVLDESRRLSFPRSVVEMMQGALGVPAGGWPRKLQKIILASAKVRPLRGRPGARLPKADFDAVKQELSKKLGRGATDLEVLSYLMYPQVFLDFARHVATFSDTSVLPTAAFFYGLRPGEEVNVEIEPGKTLVIRFLTVSDPHDDGTRTVFFELNGQPREVNIPDRTLEAAQHRHPKADPDNPNHVPAPMPGKISAVLVKPGDSIKAGQRMLSIEAMKMETAVYAPRDARIAEVLVKAGATIQAHDLLVILQ
ncbi:MAG: pyruvate carboxylase subunit B [Phycisphaerales bacterium]|nr:pyruvate carboxylase subunit B [Phycisphaerales bacterium]